jgi:hypothetical protein
MARNTFVEDTNKLSIRRQLFENVYIVSHYERSLGPVACPGKKNNCGDIAGRLPSC